MGEVLVDVEASGGPTPYSGKMTEFGAVDFRSGESFHGFLGATIPHSENSAASIIASINPSYCYITNENNLTKVNCANLTELAEAFSSWLAELDSGRSILVSDNNGFDAMWIADFFDRANLSNPFGHSSRRISDFYAGVVGDWKSTQRWKKYRITKHDHNPVHDAQGNREALAKIFEIMKQQ